MQNNTMDVTTKHDTTAYTALKIGFVLAPILAGLDKFFYFLTDWTNYLAPAIPNMLNVTPANFMYAVGVIEIVAGIGVLFKPKIFAFVVSAWLVGIICNLLLLGNYYDIALRDLGLAIGAFALGEMAFSHERTSERKVAKKVSSLRKDTIYP